MFEVGKKYKGCHTGNITTCVVISEREAVLKYDNGSFAVASLNSDRWTEYHEPVVEKHTKVITRNVIYNEEIIIMNKTNKDIIGKVEFILTDGKLTDVRIVT